jgi:hypothetical protein
MNNLKNKKTFIKNYFETIKNVTDNIDENQLQLIINILIQKIKNRNNIFVAGNGGSSSVANHLFCDFNKGIKISNGEYLFFLNSGDVLIDKLKMFDQFYFLSVDIIAGSIIFDKKRNYLIKTPPSIFNVFEIISIFIFSSLVRYFVIKFLYEYQNISYFLSGLLVFIKLFIGELLIGDLLIDELLIDELFIIIYYIYIIYIYIIYNI